MKNWPVLKFSFVLFILNLSNLHICYGQDEPDNSEFTETKNTRLDVSVGFGDKCNLNTFQWVKFLGFGEKKAFNFGGGFRVNNFNYKDLRYSSIGNNETGFSEFKASGRVFAVNFMLSAEYLWQNKFGIGGNIDLVGFGLGSCSPSSDSDYVYIGEGAKINPGTTPGALGGEPTGFNVLMGPI